MAKLCTNGVIIWSISRALMTTDVGILESLDSFFADRNSFLVKVSSNRRSGIVIWLLIVV